MRTATLVQVTGDIVTIVSLKAGDVYKRLEKESYSNVYDVRFGVVQDIMHNGEEAVITALEFTSTYSGVVEPKLKVFGTDTELKLFAAQPDEIRAHFDDIAIAADRAVKAAETDLAKKREVADRVTALIADEVTKALTAPATSHSALA